MSLIQHDNLDDRREVYHLLARLSPARRVAFVDWCCRQAWLFSQATGNLAQPAVTAQTHRLARQARHDSGADTRLTLTLYFDLWQLAAHYRFDMEEALRMLEAVGRGEPLPCVPSSGRGTTLPGLARTLCSADSSRPSSSGCASSD